MSGEVVGRKQSSDKLLRGKIRKLVTQPCAVYDVWSPAHRRSGRRGPSHSGGTVPSSTPPSRRSGMLPRIFRWRDNYANPSPQPKRHMWFIRGWRKLFRGMFTDGVVYKFMNSCQGEKTSFVWHLQRCILVFRPRGCFSVGLRMLGWQISKRLLIVGDRWKKNEDMHRGGGGLLNEMLDFIFYRWNLQGFIYDNTMSHTGG